MMTSSTQGDARAAAVERWAAVALDLDWVGQWVKGAIFPCEMVFFLATCDALGVRYIIESGRQDGVSTVILGDYARRTGVKIGSIDYEEDKERAKRCRQRLAGYPIDIRAGNAFELLGRMVRQSSDASLALLVDGPKGFSALSVTAAAAADPRVRIIAMHNMAPGLGYRRTLEGVACGVPLFYEEALNRPGEAWGRLREAERTRCVSEHATSTLALLEIGDGERRRLRRLTGAAFKFYQPPLVRLGWRLGLYRPAAALYSASFRVFGS